MAWNDTGYLQYAMPSNVRRDGGYVLFTAAGLTVDIYTYMTKVYTGFLQYRTSGVGGVFDVPLTSPFTVSSGYFTVTRPDVVSGASTIWYMIWGE